jgi:hypothetical protein
MVFGRNRLKAGLKEIVSHDYDLVSVDNYRIFLSGNAEVGRDTQEYAWIEKQPDELFLTFLTVGGIGGVYKAIFKRSVFDNIGYLDESLPVYEDLEFWLRITINGLKWGHIRKKLVFYSKRDDNNSLITKNIELNQDCRIKILKKYQSEAIKRSPAMKGILARQLWDYGRAYISEYKSIRKAIDCFVSSMVIQPNLSRVLGSLKSYLFGRKDY